MKKNIFYVFLFVAYSSLAHSQGIDTTAPAKYVVLKTDNSHFNFIATYSNGKEEDVAAALHFTIILNSIGGVKNTQKEYQQFLFQALDYIENKDYALTTSSVAYGRFIPSLPYEKRMPPCYREFYFMKSTQKTFK